MTQRERMLSILVGGLLVGVVVWWGINKYRTAVNQRTTQITNLQQEKVRLDEQVMQGFIAERQMGEYLARSLPGDANRARSVYQQWLLDVCQKNNFSGVDHTTTLPIGQLYQRIGFRVSGSPSKIELIRMMHAFYAKDYLHRIRELSIRPNKTGTFTVEMTIDVIALMTAPVDADPPGDSSWRVDADLASYVDPIMNRNYFQPPNAPPRYTGGPRVEAFVGRETPIQLAFSDPEQHNVRVEFVGDPPPFARLDSNSAMLRVRSDEKQELKLRLRAVDDGFPNRSIEQELTVAVIDPPPPPPPPPPTLKFDDASQTVLTGLTHGRDDWTAWMHVRTKGRTLKLRVGDGFEIGSLKGKVIEVTPKFVVLEIDGRRFMLKPNGNLKEAADKSEVD